MVLYCSAHETAVLRMLAHKLKNHHDEEMVFITTVGTYPFCDKTKCHDFVYKKVIEFNTALGKNFDNEELIVDSIVSTLDKLFADNQLSLADFSKIYITEDIYHPYTIYFESKMVNYTAIEISPNSFENKRIFTLEKNLYKRSPEYFRLTERLGAFCATGKYCKKRIFDGESFKFNGEEITEEIYNYQSAIATLPQNDLNVCIDLYGMPTNLPVKNEFTMALTNSRGFIEGHCPEITCDQIPRIYQKMFDYYFSDVDKIFIKPHPNSQGIDYLKFFNEEQIIDEKFLVDLIPFIENVRLDTVVNVASTASVLLKKYCKENISLGESFFKFSMNVHKVFAVLKFLEKNDCIINKIYTVDVSIEQITHFLRVNGFSNIEVECWNPLSIIEENSLIMMDSLQNIEQKLLKSMFDTNNQGVIVGVLSENNSYIYKNLSNVSVNLIEITEYINKSCITERSNCIVITSKNKCENVSIVNHLVHSGNVLEIQSLNLIYDKKVCVFGGNVSRFIIESIRKRYDAIFLPWISPLSVGVDNNLNECLNKDNLSKSIEIELYKNLFKYMESYSDYLILDLETLRYDLLLYKDNFYTDTRAFRETKFYLENETNFKSINILEKEKIFIQNFLEIFINKILSIYSPKNIILLRHGKAEKSYLEKHIIRNWRIENYNDFISEWEDFFIKKTKCNEINIWKRFMSKNKGNPLYLEQPFYQDLLWYSMQIMQKEDSHIYHIDEPRFSMSLTRFYDFYDFAIMRKCEKIFLNSENWLHLFILKTSKSFIKKYLYQLVNINNENYQDIEEALSNYNFENAEELRDALIVIRNISNTNDICHNLEYEILFKYNFEIIKDVIFRMKNKFKEWYCVEFDINENNINSYLPLANIIEENPNIKMDFLTSCNCIQKATSKTLIDIWGSCVSREVFNMWFDKYRVNKYLMRVSFMNTALKPIELEEGILDIKNFSSEFIYRNCYMEWNRLAGQRISESKANWVIVDLHDIFFQNWYYKKEENVICKTYHLDDMKFYKLIKDDLYPIEYGDDKYDDMYFINAIQNTISILEKKYKTHVIIIDAILKDSYLDEERCITPFTDKIPEKLINRKNHLVRMLGNYLTERLNCYHISITDQFFADELWHAGELARSHYERAFYEEVYWLIDTIISNEPDQKIYTDYRYKTRINRIKTLSQRKENIAEIKKIFTMQLDSILIELDSCVIEKFATTLELIYQRGFKDINEMFDKFNFADYDALELKDKMKKIYRYL